MYFSRVVAVLRRRRLELLDLHGDADLRQRGRPDLRRRQTGESPLGTLRRRSKPFGAELLASSSLALLRSKPIGSVLRIVVERRARAAATWPGWRGRNRRLGDRVAIDRIGKGAARGRVVQRLDLFVDGDEADRAAFHGGDVAARCPATWSASETGTSVISWTSPEASWSARALSSPTTRKIDLVEIGLALLPVVRIALQHDLLPLVPDDRA